MRAILKRDEALPQLKLVFLANKAIESAKKHLQQARKEKCLSLLRIIIRQRHRDLA